jgi:hypothetical protein
MADSVGNSSIQDNENNLLKFILKHEEESMSVSKIILKIVSSCCLNCRFSFSFSLLNQPTHQPTNHHPFAAAAAELTL